MKREIIEEQENSDLRLIKRISNKDTRKERCTANLVPAISKEQQRGEAFCGKWGVGLKFK
jgi:hypothetical protein